MTFSNKQLVMFLSVLLGFVVTPLPVKSQAAQVKIIAHMSVTQDELSTSQLRRIFSMRQTSWPDQQEIFVYVLNNEHGVHPSFSKHILGMFPYQLERIWNKLAYSGLGNKPITVKNEQEMLDKIRQQPGAIGYVMYLVVDDGVKFIEVEQE
ncbi:MAG: ABC-type phosphate transport system substrate-binding protein [Paraglaciecola sp.]